MTFDELITRLERDVQLALEQKHSPDHREGKHHDILMLYKHCSNNQCLGPFTPEYRVHNCVLVRKLWTLTADELKYAGSIRRNTLVREP